jgi:2,4'-dihydroxyacetophenone dioxygenase
MADPKPAADAMTPYQLPFPKEAAKEIVVESAIPKDERLWVPQAENVWFRPLCLNVSTGYWMNLLRVRKSGVLKGRWRYLEHDWEATEGSYVFEPPGETHTLYVPEDVEEMITYFQVNGVMFYCDPYGNYTGYEDVFTKVDMCRKHFSSVGLGEDFVDQFIR